MIRENAIGWGALQGFAVLENCPSLFMSQMLVENNERRIFSWLHFLDIFL